MKTEVIVALIVLAGGGLSAYVTYLVAKRQTSGSISTSDAVSLWAESNRLRAEYKDRAEKVEAQLEEVNAKLQVVNNKLQQVSAQLTRAESKSDRMIKKIGELKKVITNLRAENSRLLTQVKKGSS